jgi:hypothetical protein
MYAHVCVHAYHPVLSIESLDRAGKLSKRRLVDGVRPRSRGV